MHVFRRNPNDTTLLNNLGIFPHDTLYYLQIFHGNLVQMLAGNSQRQHFRSVLPKAERPP